MQLSELISLFQDGKMDKRVYWDLARERTLSINELVQALHKSSAERIEITGDEAELVFPSENGTPLHLLFDFSQTICRAESILLDTEREDFSFFNNFLRSGGVCLDIGANIGRVSLELATMQPNIDIYSFEPVPETYRMMLRNLEINPELSPRIHPNHLGFMDQEGEITFYVPAASEAASAAPIEDQYYLREANQGQAERGHHLQKETCPVTTLDAFAEKNDFSRIDFIKVDTEGAELKVFQGGEQTIRKFHPVIYTEMLRKHAKRFGYHPNDIIHMLSDWGYLCFREEGKHLIPFSEMTEETIETNFYFLHKDAHKETISSLVGNKD